ncbi:outer dynein arm-docking complex subunit 3-like [Cheilinus undulatus]|uniref:outer dynein arm-docking complex subunit 3-like n=1 Tax=Cheilinus undulatus TaxID=241271 RepID=UPI001BD5228B|nr:outer dynein arm-docking complex subunit 3-like [Cheilinus undulatus]
MSSKGLKKTPLQEQTEQARSELQLKEAQRAAFNKEAEARANTRKAYVTQLKQEIELLRKQITEEGNRDANVIKEALHDKPELLHFCSNMSVEKALAFLHRKKLLLKKELNLLDNDIQVNQRRQEELKMELKRARSTADAQTHEQQEFFKNLSELKEDVERIESETKELQSRIADLQKVKSQLQKEALTFPAQMEKAEAEKLRDKKELEDLHSSLAIAQQLNEATEAESKQTEKYYNEKLVEVESIKASKRKQIKELQAQVEELSKEIQRKNKQREEQRREAECSIMMADEGEKVRVIYNEAFQRIKTATGITNIQDLKQHFLSMEETQQHLVNQKEENEKMLQQLNEEKELLIQQFEDVKEKAQAKQSRNNQELELRKQQIQDAQRRCDAAKEQLNKLDKTKVTIRVCLENLAEKLEHIKLPEDRAVVESPPDSNEYLLELLTEYELKMDLLQEELQGQDLAATKTEMEEVGFLQTKGQLQASNTFVELPDDLSDEEAESRKDDDDVLSREELKRQSEKLINNSRSKKKRGKKKGRR